jgi:hypothetical protein
MPSAPQRAVSVGLTVLALRTPHARNAAPRQAIHDSTPLFTGSVRTGLARDEAALLRLLSRET